MKHPEEFPHTEAEVRAIIAERDRLKAEVEEMRGEGRDFATATRTIESLELQNEDLRRWIRNYSECDCDVSKNKGTVHWFACRYVLGRKALGEPIQTRGENVQSNGPSMEWLKKMADEENKVDGGLNAGTNEPRLGREPLDFRAEETKD